MIENIKNIGQMLITARQAVSDSRESQQAKRFSICSQECQPADSDNEISMPDNNEDVRKTEGKNKPDEDSSEKLESVNSAAAFIIDAPAQNELPEQAKITEAALDVSEKSNSVTGHALKSEQIKILHETEKGQLGIKTILPENSNGQNGLKELPTQPNTEETEIVAPENQVTQNSSIQAANEIPEEETTEILVNKNLKTNAADNENIENILPQRKITQQDIFPVSKDERSGSDARALRIDLFKNLQKAAQETASFNNTQESLVSGTKQINENSESEINGSESLEAWTPIFNDGKSNTGQTFQHKAEIADILPSDVKANDQSVSILDNTISVEQSFSNIETTSEKSAVITSVKANADMPRDNSDTDISAQISRQISESIHSSVMRQGGEKQVTVRLNPPELGSVTIKFSQQNSELTGTLEVSNSQTKFEIEQALPQIIRSLSDSGIQLKKIDVFSSETGQGDSDSMKEQLFQNNNSGQSDQYSDSSQHAGAGDFNKSRFQQWFSNTMEYTRGYSTQNHFAASGSINMLL